MERLVAIAYQKASWLTNFSFLKDKIYFLLFEYWFATEKALNSILAHNKASGKKKKSKKLKTSKKQHKKMHEKPKPKQQIYK